MRRVALQYTLRNRYPYRVVIELNERALRALACEKRLEIVPGATHLFEEPGTLDRVIVAAGGWFESHLGVSRS